MAHELDAAMYKTGQRPQKQSNYGKEKVQKQRTSRYEWLSKENKKRVDSFDVEALHYFAKQGNWLNIFWIMGILTDDIDVYPNKVISDDHTKVIEEFANIYQEWDYLVSKVV